MVRSHKRSRLATWTVSIVLFCQVETLNITCSFNSSGQFTTASANGTEALCLDQTLYLLSTQNCAFVIGGISFCAAIASALRGRLKPQHVGEKAEALLRRTNPQTGDYSFTSDTSPDKDDGGSHLLEVELAEVTSSPSTTSEIPSSEMAPHQDNGDVTTGDGPQESMRTGAATPSTSAAAPTGSVTTM